jgi:hypothetical protein
MGSGFPRVSFAFSAKRLLLELFDGALSLILIYPPTEDKTIGDFPEGH